MGAHYLFDNHEFAASNLVSDYTLSGFRLCPEIGLRWDEKHSVFGGFSSLALSGSQKIIDQIKISAYYQYKDKKTSFYAGAFPRSNLLSDFSEFMFQDSIAFTTPLLQGLYFKKGDEKAFIKLFLDWNGWQTKEQRESFFLGASGYKQYKSFFFDFQSYLFHLANTNPSREELGVCDNFQLQIGAGVDFSKQTKLDKLNFSTGLLAGFERVRVKSMTPYMPLGILLKSQIQYKYFGHDLLYYGGKARMKFYDTLGPELYSGSPFLRANHYIQSKLFCNIIINRFVSGELAFKTHYSEKKILTEQRLSIFISLE